MIPPFQIPSGALKPKVSPEAAKELLEQAKFHLSEANRMQDEKANLGPPDMQHHKANLGIYAVTALLTALDPTHQAGSAFFGGFKNGTNARDQQQNQESQQAWLHRAQALAEGASRQTQTGLGILKTRQEQIASEEKSKAADAHGELLRQFAAIKNDLNERKFKESKWADFAKTLVSARKMMDSKDENEKRSGSFWLKHLIQMNNDLIGERGESFDDLVKEADANLKGLNANQVHEHLFQLSTMAGTKAKNAASALAGAKADKIKNGLPGKTRIPKGTLPDASAVNPADMIGEIGMSHITSNPWARVSKPKRKRKGVSG